MYSGKIPASKKATGLGFVALIILFALLFFIFKYSTMTYSFSMEAGDEQAHLVAGYTEAEKAKTFVAYALRQAAYEAIWSQMKDACDANNKFRSNICTDAAKSNILTNTKSLFDKSTAIYAAGLEALDTRLPEYYLNKESACNPDKIEIEAFGYNAECFLKSNFAFPEFPCEDQEMLACGITKFTNGDSGACIWRDEACRETNPDPRCGPVLDEQACSDKRDGKGRPACEWRVSYSENIFVTSAPSTEYQFKVGSDAHFKEAIGCTSYEAFKESRSLAIKPRCTLKIAPLSGTPATNFAFSITYRDDTEPSILTLKVVEDATGNEVASVDKAGLTPDAGTDYPGGKLYTYARMFSIGDYTATVECKDADGNTAAGSGRLHVT